MFRWSRVAFSLILSISIILSSLYFPVSSITAGGGSNESPISAPSPDKGNPKLDSYLNQLISSEPILQAYSFDQSDSNDVSGENVRVVIECLPDQVDSVMKAVESFATFETTYENLVQASVPVSNLNILSEAAGVRFIRLPFELHESVISEGVSLIGADDWQTSGYTGSGVKIAVLDPGGFSGYISLLGSELPDSVVTWYTEGTSWPGDSVHGTACAEIIHDIAPDAQLYLYKASTETELGNAVLDLINKDVDVISFSAGSPVGGPGNGTGTMCDIVENARDHGILWVNAMGNYGGYHWQGNFNDSGVTTTGGYPIHQFDDAGDLGNSISASPGDVIRVYLKWDDVWGAPSNDYDLFLYQNGVSEPVASSYMDQSVTLLPLEYLSYSVTSAGNYFISIVEYGSSRDCNFHLYSQNQPLEYWTLSGSLAVPADSSFALAVGAVRYSTPDTLEYFSSQGPTTDGRIKPDLVAPDGVSTVSYGTNDFYGTSASTPHVAGLAALIKSRFPSYTPSQIQSLLESNAIELGDAGKDSVYGSGRVDLPLVPLVLNSPANGATVYRLNPQLQWDTYSGASDYSIRIATDSAFSDLIANDTGLTSNSYDVGIGLNWDDTYYWQVNARDSLGNTIAWSAVGTFITTGGPPPATPSAGSAIAISPRQVNLTWSDNSNDETGFTLERTTGDASYSEIVTVNANTTAYSDNNDLVGGTTYSYRIKSVNAVNYSDYKDFIPVTTLPYIKPTVTTYDNSDLGLTFVTLNGNLGDLGTAETATVSFQYGEASGVYTEETAPGETMQTQLLCVDSSLFSSIAGLKPSGTRTKLFIYVPGEAYLPWLYTALANYGITQAETAVVVLAESDIYQALNLGVIDAALITSHPSTALQSYIASGELSLLSWSTECVDSLVTAYPDQLIASFLPAGTYYTGQPVTTGYAEIGDFSIKLTDLFAATPYYYRAVARGGADAGGAEDGYGLEKSFITLTPTTVPPDPSGLNATVRTVDNVDLIWVGDSHLESGFRIERSQTADPFIPTDNFNVGKGVNTYTDTTTISDTIYYYRVFAYNDIDDSINPTNTVTVIVPGIPEAPDGLTATAVSKTQINLAWTDNANDEAHYLVQRKTGATGTYALIATLDPDTVSYSDTGLSSATTYYYQVIASNIAGDTPSNEASAMTQSASTGGGGGGGGGGASLFEVNTTGLTTTARLYVDKRGTVLGDVHANLDSGTVDLFIAKNTKMTYAAGTRLDKLTITQLASPPSPPDNKTVLLAYEFGPEGAIFNPPLTLTLKYGTLPDGVDVSDINLAYWDGTAWVIVPGTLDAAAGTITAQISHFSKYAVIAGLLPSAEFTISDLMVNPAKVQIDEPVTVQTTVTNNGGSSGEYKLVLKLDGTEIDSKTVNLDPGKTETVTFKVMEDKAGVYTLDVNGKTGQFELIALPAPTISYPTISIPLETYQPTQTPVAPAIETSAPVQENKPTSPVAWIIIGIVVVACAVIGMVFLVRRSKHA